MNAHTRQNSDRRPRGFTLIELLVVISIIALLISVLLPSMVGARRTGQRVACMGNMREMANGAAQYGNDNEDWIIGAPGGSGAYLRGATTAFGPAVQRWDFMGPLSTAWGMGLTANDGAPADWAKRFDDLRGQKVFLCPANKFLAFRYSGPMQAGAGWMVSYNTCRYQLWIKANSAAEADQPGDAVGLSWYDDYFQEHLPAGWRPSTTRIGVPANKAFIADGARYSTVSLAPDFELTVEPVWGGAFSDTGVYSTFSKSWDRSRAPGNGDAGSVDARMYAFRHSTAEPSVGAPANAFKLNVAYYDGHVDSLGDLEASNPRIWLPAGTILTNAGTAAWPDAVQRFGLQGDVKIGG